MVKESIAFISGSPRKGNTDFILSELYDSINYEKKHIFFLREYHIGHCLGCLNCYKKRDCLIKDDGDDLLKNIAKADILVIGSPNYFDNVPGLLKDFMDRTSIYLGDEKLKNKKVFFIVVGGGRLRNSKLVIDQALFNFSKSHQMKNMGGFCFRFMESGDAQNDTECQRQIEKIKKILNNINY